MRKAAIVPLTLISPEELDRLDADPVAAASRVAMTADAALFDFVVPAQPNKASYKANGVVYHAFCGSLGLPQG